MKSFFQLTESAFIQDTFKDFYDNLIYHFGENPKLQQVMQKQVELAVKQINWDHVEPFIDNDRSIIDDINKHAVSTKIEDMDKIDLYMKDMYMQTNSKSIFYFVQTISKIVRLITKIRMIHDIVIQSPSSFSEDELDKLLDPIPNLKPNIVTANDQLDFIFSKLHGNQLPELKDYLKNFNP